MSQTLKAEPFLKLSSGQEAYHHQLFVEKDEKLVMPSVQQLFEQSFLSSGIKLKEVSKVTFCTAGNEFFVKPIYFLQVPPTLIIQMPRFGKSYKMYPYVLPSSLLDITDVLENCKEGFFNMINFRKRNSSNCNFFLSKQLLGNVLFVVI